MEIAGKCVPNARGKEHSNPAETGKEHQSALHLELERLRGAANRNGISGKGKAREGICTGLGERGSVPIKATISLEGI